MWRVSFSGDSGEDLTVDKNGNIFVIGSRYGHIWVMKLRAVNGSILWHRYQDLPYGIGYGVHVGDFGPLYAVASSTPSGACWVAKMDTVTADFLPGWPRIYPDCYASSPLIPNYPRAAIDVDESGNIYIGAFPLSGGAMVEDYLLMKLDPDGNEIWRITYDSPEGRDFFHDMAVDESGSAYVIGETWVSDVPSKVYLLKAKPDGSGWDTWNMVYPWAGYRCCRRQTVHVSPSDGSLYAAGQYDTGSEQGTWMQKWDSSLNPVWFKQYPKEELAGGEHMHDLAIGPNVCGGSLFVSGDIGHIWTGRFSAETGNFMDSTLDSSAGHGNAVDLDSQYAYVAGAAASGGVWVGKFYADCGSPPPVPPTPPPFERPSRPPAPEPSPPPPPAPAAPPSPLCDAYNYPNPKPSGGVTTIRWELPEGAEVDLTITDLTGRIVKEWHFAEDKQGGWAGINELTWDGTNQEGKKVIQGMYAVSLNAGDGVCSKKFLMGVLP